MSEPESRKTPITFSREETAQIRRLIVTPDARVACPRCDGDLEIGHPIAGGTVAIYWELNCPHCNRSLIVRDLPEGQRGAGSGEGGGGEQ